MRRLLGAATLSAVSAIMSRGILFAGVLLLASRLGPEDYGHFSLIQTTSFVFTTFCALSLGQMATKIVAEAASVGPEKIGTALSVSYGSVLICSLPLCVGLIISSRPLAQYVGGAEYLSTSYMAASLLVLAGFLSSMQSGVFLAIGRTRTQAIVNICVAPLALAIIFLASNQRTVISAVLGYAAAQLLFVVVQEAALRRYRRDNGVALSLRAPAREDWAIVWKLGLPSSVAGLFGVLATWSSMVFLARSPGGVVSVGHFALGNQARMILLFLVGVIANAALPMLSVAEAKGQRERSRKLVRQSTIFVLVVSAATAAVVAIFAKIAISTYLASYSESLGPLIWLLGAAVVTAPTAILMRKATSETRPGVLLVGNACYAIVLVIVAFTFIYMGFGASGLGSAFFVAAIIQLLMYIYLTSRRFRKRRIDEGEKGLGS